MASKIIAVHWFSQSGPTIGIVTVEDETTGERKAYVGTGDGFDEQADIKRIRELGGKADIGRFEAIVKELKT